MVRGSITSSTWIAALACAALAASPAQAATTTSGPVTYVTAKATIGEGGTDTVAAECPGETSVSGGGGAFTTSPEPVNAVEIAYLRPVDFDLGAEPDDAYEAAMAVGEVGSRTFRTTAICLEPSDDPSAITYASQSNTVPAGNNSTAGGVVCSSGEIAGGGFHATAVLADLELEELGFSFTGNKPNEDRVAFGFSKDGPAADYTAYAICSSQNLKHVFKAAVTFAGLTTLKVACPRTHRVVGGGFGRFPTDLVASEPYDSKDKGKAPDDGWKLKVRSGSSAIQAMQVGANCLKK